MQRGLEGRRIAVVSSNSAEQVAEIRKELIAAGALVNELASDGDEQEWHGGKYAGLVLIGGGEREPASTRVAQLIREFMVSEKPVAALDVDARALQLDESLLAVKGSVDARRFARDVVTEFAERLEEHDLDEMSDESFPASDPPAVNPGAAGHVSPDPEERA